MPRFAVFAVALLATPAAHAAQPVTGGRYEGRQLALTISDDGRSLSPQPFIESKVKLPACGDLRRRTVTLADANGALPLQIFTSGRFVLHATLADGRTVSINGRFRTRKLATGVVLGGSLASTCHTRTPFTIRYTGERHKLFGTCNPPHSRTLAAQGDLRIYSEPFFDGNQGWDYGQITRVAVACSGHVGNRNIVEVAAANAVDEFGSGYTITSDWTIAGRFFGVLFNECCENGVVFIEAGRLADGEVVNGVGCYDDEFNPCAGIFFLSPSGPLVWSSKSGQPAVTRVAMRTTAEWKPDGSGTPDVLDTDVVVDSLKLDGTHLSWRKPNGETRSAEIP